MVRGQFSYPLPVTRKRYLTELGGRSDLLEEGEVGLHAEALISNTDLEPGESILIGSTEKDNGGRSSPPTPLYKREVHEVKPLTDLDDSRLLAMTSEGEAILSPNDSLEIELGDEVVLNASIDRLSDDWINRLIRDKVSNSMK